MRRYRWEAALVGICAIWGWTFVLVRDAVARVPPFQFLALRFTLGALVLAATGALRGVTRDDLRAGALTGATLFGGYAFQTVGQQYTSASNAGFITGLFVVFTPLLGAIALRALPAGSAMIGASLATAGLFLLAAKEGLVLSRGDLLMLATAAVFAVHILLLGRLGPGRKAVRFAAIQIWVAAALCWAWTLAAERAPVPGSDGDVWVAIAVTGILATALGFVVQTRTQQEVPPVRTAVILTAEPVFAGIFGYVLAGDRLGARGYLGAALIVVGIVVAELFAPERERL